MDNTDTNLEAQIQNELGVPPVPPMPPVGAAPEGAEVAAEPAMTAADAMAAELANVAPEPIAPITSGGDDANATLDALVADAPAADAPAMDAGVAPAAADLTAAAPAMGGDDLESIKKSMLKDLFPLMDRVNVSAGQRFRIYHEMIEDSGDKSLISAAYEAAKGIEDETERAEALLFLVESADK